MRLLAGMLLALMLAACSTAETGQPQRLAQKKQLPPAPPPPTVAEEAVVCPMDVKGCADGSYVGRDPAQGCAFHACPTTNNK